MRTLVALALALALCAPLTAGEGAAWRSLDVETGQVLGLAGLEQLARDFPDSASVRLRLLAAQMAADDFDGVVSTLEWLKARGHVFSEAAQASLAHHFGDQGDAGDAPPINAFLTREPDVIEASEVIARIPAEAGLIESVFAPPGRDMLVATSLTGRAVHIFEPGAGWTAVAVPGASDLSGIVGEPDDSMGWAASANLDGSEDDTPLFTGLMGLRTDFQNPIHVPLPEGGRAVSDLTIGPDATVYASDPTGGGIYAKPVGATVLETLVPPGTFRSPQGMALSADGARLYVSDYRYGIAIVDLASGAVTRLESEVPAILDGTDGLWLHDGALIAMQNGASPMRITAFTLSEDGTSITASRVLEQAHPGWTEPLGGTIADGALVYVATGQWDRYDRGQLKPGMAAIPTQIRRLPLK
jgi:hypothetical protein